MLTMPALRHFTIADLDAIPEDGNRYEVLHGVLLVTPSPGLPHQSVAMRLSVLLAEFLRPEAGVEVWGPGVVQIEPDFQCEPDILVGRFPPDADWASMTDRRLAVEVSGVGSRVYDREYKRDAYLSVGVAEVWLLDLALQAVLVSRAGEPAKDVLHRTSVRWRSPAGRELVFDVPSLFAGLPHGSRV
jgi:Uma2 family endonuclease